MTETFSPPRSLEERELAILDFLLAKPFPGRDELREQLAHVRVDASLPYGTTVYFTVDEQLVPKADTLARVPIEAEGHDTDGMLYQVLLHVVDGLLSELEVYRIDLEQMLVPPQANALTLKYWYDEKGLGWSSPWSKD